MFEYICSVICKGQGIPRNKVFARTRKKEVVFARQLIMYFMVQYKQGSLEYIANLCNMQGHYNTINSCTSIKNYIETDPQKRDLVESYDEVFKPFRPGIGVNLVNELLIKGNELNVRVAELEKHHQELESIIKDLEDRLFKLEARLSQQRGPKAESRFPYTGYNKHSR